ncbi:hypothetical protein KP509_03G089300 [Ceratopteris richardii]|uniref:GDSL esterase/lipase n=1 Tax=Ceratopteris richardii TaxID=49495 RepID=A0A8T2V1T4_CERRI|nr:hypothetical protein KP509_03G089300 [Ceratopteris richardii]
MVAIGRCVIKLAKSALTVLLLALLVSPGVRGDGLTFPAYFIFGDSLVDVGNNNYITTVARANSLPFGIDFPSGPTGRFTNGRTVPDVLCEKLSLPFPPPYLAPTTRGAAVLQGVNYASAAAGIDRLTGYNFIGRVDFSTQISWFNNTINELNQQIGQLETQQLLKSSLFSITLGANDYVNNYILKDSPASIYTPSQFLDILITEFESQLLTLNMLGARIISITSIGPIGCIPAVLARRSQNGECSEYVNNLALDFNTELQRLLTKLTTQNSGSIFIYQDGFTSVFDYISNPQKYGFKFGSTACCGAGRFNGNVLCLPIIKPCPDRDDYVFWDCYHPSDAANVLIGNQVYDNLQRILAN